MTTAPPTAFSEAQYDEAYPPGVEASFWHVARNAIIARELEEGGMASLPLLEIGCGRGIVVEHLRARGMDCTECDLATPTVPEPLRPFVRPGTDFHALPEAERSRVEGVLLCDVIEHLRDPAELLRELAATFPALRRVLITVPARAELWSQWDEHFGHFRRYDRRMLAADVARAGLTPVTSRYFFHALYAPMFAARGKRRDTTIAAPRLPLVHRLLGGVFVAEHRLSPAWMPGTSIVAVCRVDRRV